MSPAEPIGRRARWLFVLAAVAATASACMNDEGGAPPLDILVQSGEYTLDVWTVTPDSLAREAQRGHPATGPRTLTYDRAAGTVTVRYTLASGRPVVEVWRATPQP